MSQTAFVPPPPHKSPHNPAILTTQQVGTISWTEIPVLSIPRSAAFYKAIFSWETTSLPGATEECTDNTTQDGGATAADPGHAFSGGRPPMVIFFKGKTHGAFVQCPEQHLLTASTDRENINRTTVAVTVTITVEDIGETLAAVVKNGGKVWM